MLHQSGPFAGQYSRSPRGRSLQSLPDFTVGGRWRPLDLTNADAPAGWYSVWHWIAQTEPASLRHCGDDLYGAFLEFQDEALRLCEEEGVAPLEWPAPPAIADAASGSRVFLFPDPILRDTLPRMGGRT